ncbi:MAG: hypothetical protein OHM77_04620 [Candidatus Nitricoxidivorans perseverans]|uniref:Uncharacterized protein n=1 Tax=Candidatus Nitricoxidivorans perseverans TaxID=2975601 RepID=A0AA49IZI9_9PROT|nr:MAG: hypothetical protein OHM77_04620 [Candidatus Nitricoxidivorans perseverans]
MGHREEMSHWARKHMGDIASIANRFAEDMALPPAQREAFDHANTLARSIATCRMECNRHSVGLVVATLCAACLPGRQDGHGQCHGRRDWRDHCDLITSQLSSQGI